MGKRFLHDVVGSPKNTILVHLLAWIEPQPIPLFPSSGQTAIAIHIGLEPPWFPFYVPQKFDI